MPSRQPSAARSIQSSSSPQPIPRSRGEREHPRRSTSGAIATQRAALDERRQPRARARTRARDAVADLGARGVGRLREAETGARRQRRRARRRRLARTRCRRRERTTGPSGAARAARAASLRSGELLARPLDRRCTPRAPARRSSSAHHAVAQPACERGLEQPLDVARVRARGRSPTIAAARSSRRARRGSRRRRARRSVRRPGRRPAPSTRAPLGRELARAREAPLDPGDDLVERARLVEGARTGDVAVVLADHALRGPRLAGRRALVVEDADRGPVVDERVEQDRARRSTTTASACWRSVASTSMSVKLGSCTAAPGRPSAAANRSRHSRSRGCGRKRSEKRAVAPDLAPTTRRGARRTALVRRVRRRVPHHRDDRPRGVEPVAAGEASSNAARGRRLVEDVRLRPAGHDDPLARRRRGSGRGRRASARSGRRSGRGRSRSRPCRRCDPSSRRSRRCVRPSRRAEHDERRRRLHLEVREDERRPLRARAAAGARSRRSAAARSASARIARSIRGRTRQRPDARRVEELVAVAGQHPLAVEAVAQVEADRERVVADPPVEPAVGAAADALGRRRPAPGRGRRRRDARTRPGAAPPTRSASARRNVNATAAAARRAAPRSRRRSRSRRRRGP